METLGGDVGAGCLAGLGLQPGPLHHAPGACSTAGAPAWGSLSHSAHARPSRGDPALLPTFLFSHAAGGPLPPAPQAETGPVLGGGQQQPLRDTLLPSWPQPFAALSFVSALVSECLSNVVSATTNLCLSLFWPRSSPRKVPVCFCFRLLVCLSLGSLSGTKSGDTSALLSGS